MPLKIIFAGTPEFAVPSLEALLHSEHKILAVYTQPDRPAGRGRKLTPSPIKELAMRHSIPIHQPEKLRDPEEQKILASYEADIMIVAAYGLILPKPVLAIPRFGCVNVHASLLPRWRGAAPIQRAIQAGDTETGVTIMQMDAGLDTGKMLKKSDISIGANETAAELLPRLALLGAEELLLVLSKLAHYQEHAETQNETEATYAAKLNKTEAAIDWNQTAEMIHHQICAFNPWPVATTTFQNEILRVWRSELSTHISQVAPGTLVSLEQGALHIQTGKGVVMLTEVQLPGGKRIKTQDFIHAHVTHLEIGTAFD